MTLSQGWAQLPEWWMEITPHHTLDAEQDEARRRRDKQEADMYAHLAAQADELHPDAANYKLGDNGELLDQDGNEINVEEDDGSGKSKYTRSPKTGEWMLDGKPLFGRQFKPVEVPEGYAPGGSFEYNNSGGKSGSSDLAWVMNSKSTLKSTSSAPGQESYGHQDNNWKKPDWMKVKLKSTDAGGNIRKGDYTQTEGKITMATQKAPSVPLKSTT
jgi:hypothetical protein